MKRVSSAVLVLMVCISGLMVFSASAPCLTASALSSGVTWSLYLNQSTTPLQSETVDAGGEFVLDTEGMTVAGSADLLAALDDIRFSLEGIPPGDLEIRLILNTQGGSFNTVYGKPCSFNMTFAMYVNGHETQSSSVSVSMTIPNGTGLDHLLGLGGLTKRTDLAFASFTDGSIKPERVATSILTQTVVVVFDTPATIVGGDSTNLGIPATVEYSTWYKVKKLFE